ncbi:hypothetical protein RQP46_004579 [Phenoliferia psychrophenolica]
MVLGVDSLGPPKVAPTLPPSGKWPLRKLILNAFDCIVPSHLIGGTWTGEKEGHRFDSIDYWQETAKLLERGKFHGIFIADSYGFHDTYEGKIDASLRAGFQVPKLDPLLVVPIMASVTTNLAFGVTSSTTYEQPYALARRYTTLDHLTNGRVAWNIVTSHLPSAARNMGLAEAVEHDLRYEIADEYLDVVYALWEGSWHDDAVKRDVETKIWADPALVRPINHKGKHFKDIPGPFISHPSPQRTPALYQAGSSGAGTTFGAKHAEAVFIMSPTPKLAAGKVAEYREKVAQAGRDPRSLKVLPGILIILGHTTEEAEEKYTYWKAHADREAALAFNASSSGTDWAQWGPDEELTPVEGTGGFVMLQQFKRAAPEIKTWTRTVLADFLTLNRHGALAVGTPSQVADELERWIEIGDIDGFNLSHFSRNETFEDIVDLLVPELQRRGLLWQDYPEVPQPEGAIRKVGLTAREGLLGVGQKHLPKESYGHRFKWI